MVQWGYSRTYAAALLPKQTKYRIVSRTWPLWLFLFCGEAYSFLQKDDEVEVYFLKANH